MWYTTKDNSIDLNKPIMAIRMNSSAAYLLVPCIVEGGYTVEGYNWLNIETGGHNSCATYKTAEEAMKSYSSNHTFVNCTIQEDVPTK